MDILTLRRWVTNRVRDATVAIAPRLSRPAVDRARPLVARLGPHLPVLARHVAENMRAAGVYSRQAHRDYFAGVGEHVAGALHVLRCSARGPQNPSPEFLGMSAERIGIDGSIELLRANLRGDRGAIIMGPHISNYLMTLARLNREVPVTSLQRYTGNPGKRALEQRYRRVSNVQWISEPPGASGPMGRLKPMSDAVKAGRVLIVASDLPRTREDGLPVRLLGREIYLPAGAAVVAARTSAPLFILTARMADGRPEIVLRGPLTPELHQTGAGRRALVHFFMQTFADSLERMLIEHPALWFFWADKRWTRVFHDDPRYTRRLSEPASNGTVRDSLTRAS